MLLLSGGVSGTAKEVLKWGVADLDYVELDPLVLAAGRRFFPESLDNPRIHVHAADGREFVKGLKREMISLSPEEQPKWKQAVQPLLDNYVKAAQEKALPGEQFLKDVQDLIAKYSQPAGQ